MSKHVGEPNQQNRNNPNVTQHHLPHEALRLYTKISLVPDEREAGPTNHLFAIQGVCDAVNIHVAHKKGKLVASSSLQELQGNHGAGMAPPGAAEIHTWTFPGTSLGKPGGA